MTNSIVSVRVPESLLDAFKESSKRDHYLDLSEAVRSIVRKRWLQNKDPQTYEIRKLREDITQNIDRKVNLNKKEQIIQELEKIKKELEDNA